MVCGDAVCSVFFTFIFLPIHLSDTATINIDLYIQHRIINNQPVQCLIVWCGEEECARYDYYF